MVGGLYDNESQDAKDSKNYIDDYMQSFSPGSRIMLFTWEHNGIFAGDRMIKSIRARARRLLDCLVDVRGYGSAVRV